MFDLEKWLKYVTVFAGIVFDFEATIKIEYSII